jgi:hypothetical protein
MGIANVTWEDEENNRHVELSIAYEIENQAITIREITPKSVSFLCEQRRRPVESIGVHTPAGRRLLSEQFQQSRGFQQWVQQIGDPGCTLTA